MQYTIDTSKQVNINWNSTGKDRIIQNVTNLINTFRYEIAYSREKGIDPDLLDKPADIMAAGYIAEVYRVIEEYESRVNVVSVDISGVDDEGNMQFKVVIEL